MATAQGGIHIDQVVGRAAGATKTYQMEQGPPELLFGRPRSLCLHAHDFRVRKLALPRRPLLHTLDLDVRRPHTLILIYVYIFIIHTYTLNKANDGLTCSSYT